MDTKIKVLLIDPWPELYCSGLAYGLSDYTDLTVSSCYQFINNSNANYRIKNVFFKVSDKMKPGKLRKAVRGLEYILAYKKIYKMILNDAYDIVHIQWLLHYKTDIKNLKKLKKSKVQLIYTAHNVLPHTDSHKAINDLRKIYELVDIIVVHGEHIVKEFNSYFPDLTHKIRIQYHGTYLNQNTEFNDVLIDNKIKAKFQNRKKIYLFFGNIFYNKGVDRLIKIWLELFKDSNSLLVVAGKTNGEYKELSDLEGQISACKNILFLNYYIEDNLMNYIINNSNLIILPYRHASMSGVIFTASEFSVPILSTRVGSIEEYIIDERDGFLVDNSDVAIKTKLLQIDTEFTNEHLKSIGRILNKDIEEKYSWKNISNKLVNEVYNSIQNNDDKQSNNKDVL